MADHTDIIACFVSGIGGLFTWSNVYRLYVDRTFKGVNWLPTVYFTFAGGYSAFFLHHLHQHYAFIGTMITVSANLCWIILAYIYTHSNKYPTK